MIDEYVSSLTITQEEIQETERLTKGQSRNKLWFEKRKTVLTASNFGNVAKTKVEPSNKLKAILYSNFTTEAVQYGIESEQKAVDLFTREMSKHGATVAVEQSGLSLSKDKPYLGASLDRIAYQSAWWLATIWTIFMFKRWFKVTFSGGKIRPTI